MPFVCTDLREMGMEIMVTLMNSRSYKIVNFILKIYLSCNSLFYVLRQLPTNLIRQRLL